MAERLEFSAEQPRELDWYALITAPKAGSASLGKALKLFAAFAIVV